MSRTLRYLILAAVVGAAFLLGFVLRGPEEDPGDTPEVVAAGEADEPQRWTCAMHPQIILPTNDQKCPICFMDLIPLEEGAGDAAAGELTLTETAAALAGVATEPVQRRFVAREIRLVGKIRPDEARIGRITARVGGRLDRLFVNTTGQVVRAGDPVAEIYSPELYSAQAELQAAGRAAAKDTAAGALRGSARANLEAAGERLRLWGMGEEQIRAIAGGGRLREHLTVTAPTGGVVLERMATEGDYVKTGEVLYTIADLDRVWATLQVFETDVASLREGQEVTFRARAHPGRTFAGTILFLDPVLDPRTRTVEARVEVANDGGLLKPGMLVEGRVAVLLDAAGLPVADRDGADPPRIIPVTAPLRTGDRAIVYVRRPGDGDPVFAGRQVTLGPRAGEHFIVLEGLETGEAVVTRGNFKIDSALQIQAAPSMMNPPGGQEHPAPEPLVPGAVPDCFGEALNAVLASYYDLQAALAGDEETGSAAAAGRVMDAVAGLDCPTAGLPSDVAGRWNRALARLRDAAAKTAAAPDMGRRREAFEPLSDLLWENLALFGTGTDEPVRRFHCPMAFDDRGAFWIQKGETTANPYYGDMMLRCGSQKEVLEGPDAGGGHVH